MFESKYSKVLTAILIIVIIAIVGLLGFLGYDYFQKYMVTKNTSEFVDNFQGDNGNQDSDDQNEENQNNENESNPFENIQDPNTSSGNGTTKKTYEGFGVLGTIEIPAINIKYPILEKVTKRSIEVAVAFLYGTRIK